MELPDWADRPHDDPHRKLASPRTYAESREMANIVERRYEALTDEQATPGSTSITYQRLTETDQHATDDGWHWDTLLPVLEETGELWHGLRAIYPQMGPKHIRRTLHDLARQPRVVTGRYHAFDAWLCHTQKDRVARRVDTIHSL